MEPTPSAEGSIGNRTDSIMSPLIGFCSGFLAIRVHSVLRADKCSNCAVTPHDALCKTRPVVRRSLITDQRIDMICLGNHVYRDLVTVTGYSKRKRQALGFPLS